MAGWEEELALLLRELGVKQEEPQTQLRPTSKPSRKPIRSDVSNDSKRREQFADSLFWSTRSPDSDVSEDDDDPWLDDLGIMRREIDSIVRQVIRLMQRGGLEPSLKEDVMVVLQALQRRAMVTQQAAATDEAYLESASAMLHFCRLVLQLSECATEDL